MADSVVLFSLSPSFSFVNVEFVSLQVAIYSCERTRGSEGSDGALCMDFLQNILLDFN